MSDETTDVPAEVPEKPADAPVATAEYAAELEQRLAEFEAKEARLAAEAQRAEIVAKSAHILTPAVLRVLGDDFTAEYLTKVAAALGAAAHNPGVGKGGLLPDGPEAKPAGWSGIFSALRK